MINAITSSLVAGLTQPYTAQNAAPANASSVAIGAGIAKNPATTGVIGASTGNITFADTESFVTAAAAGSENTASSSAVFKAQASAIEDRLGELFDMLA